MSVAIPMTEPEFQDLLRRVEDGLRRIQREAQRLRDNVERWLDWLGPFGGTVRSALNKVSNLIESFVREVTDFYSHPGSPWTLWEYGNRWAGAPIGGRVSSQVAKSTLDEARVDDFWQGVAADAYKNTLPRQKEALAAVKEAADRIDDALSEVAVAICVFWLAILALIVEVVLVVSGAIGIAGTVVGLPAALAAVAGVVAKALGILITIAGIFLAFAGKAVNSVKDLQQRCSNSNAFPDGRWPRSTFDMSDGRLSDGDPTDWRMRQ